MRAPSHKGRAGGPYREGPSENAEQEEFGRRLLRLRITPEDARRFAEAALEAAKEKQPLQPSLDLLFRATFMGGVAFAASRAAFPRVVYADELATNVFLSGARDLYRGEIVSVYSGASMGRAAPDEVFAELRSLMDREERLGVDVARAKGRSVASDASQIGAKGLDLREAELRFYRNITRKSLFERFMGVRSSGSASRRKR